MEQKHICLNQECPYWDVATYRQCDKNIDIYACPKAKLVLPVKSRAQNKESPAIPQQPQAGSDASPKPCANCQHGPIDSCDRLCLHNVTFIDHYIPRTASAVR